MRIIPRRSKPAEIFEDPTKLYCGGVCFTAEAVFELDRGYVLCSVRKNEIQSAALNHGSGAEHPVIQSVFAGLLVLVGVCGTIPLINGNYAAIRYEIGALFFGVVGGWMLWEAIRQRSYLLITTQDDRRKIMFCGGVDQARIQTFLDEAQTRFGYSFGERVQPVQSSSHTLNVN